MDECHRDIFHRPCFKFVKINAIHRPDHVSGIVRMPEKVNVGELHLVFAGDFRGHAARHHHLVRRPFDGIVLTDGILGDHFHHVGCAAHGPVGDVEYHPGAGGPHKEVAAGIPQFEVPEVERSVRSFVPGI